MTFQPGSDRPANPSGGPPAEPPLDLARLAADLEPRAARIERFVEGLISVLARFDERARGENPAEIFADFEAPDASHEALRVLNEASTSARHDLAVLRRDIRPLVRGNASGVEPAIVGRIREVGLGAGALAARYESFATVAREWLATPAAAEHPPSAAAIEALRGFISIADRALRDVAESAFIIQREDGHDAFGVVPADSGLATEATGQLATFRPHRNWGVRRAVLAAAAAGGVWSQRLARAVGTRSTRIAIELGAVGTVGAVILISTLAGGSPQPSPTDGDASLYPSLVASDGSIAVGSTSPETSPDSSPGATPGPSLAPGETPPPTRRPGSSPAPSTPGSSPGASSGPSAGPSSPPSAAPSGATPTPTPTPRPAPTPTPAPTPSPTLAPAAAAAQFASRVTARASDTDDLLDAITAAVQDVDFVLAGNLAENLESLAATERAWLQAHPPAACYQTHYANALARYADLIATAVEIQADADAENGNAIHNEVGSGNAEVAALRLAANKALAACP